MLTLNGTFYTAKELQENAEKALALSVTPEWKKAFWQFIAAWLGPQETITLKTSGTTGQPTTMQFHRETMRQSARLTQEYFGYKRGDSALLVLPTQYVAGKMMIVRAIESGLNLLLFPPSGDALQKATQHADFAPVVPMQAKDAISRGSFLKHISALLLGGAPVDAQLEEQLQHVYASAYHSYGMTETLTHVAIRRLNGPGRSKLFQALPGVHFSTDARECLAIRAPHIAGKVQTNDVVKLLSPTQFQWLGRADHVINSGGVKLHPESIEARIAAIMPAPFVLIGKPHNKLGSQLTLVLERPPLAQKEEEKLQRAIAARVHAYEKPGKISYKTTFPRTASGKIKRSAL